MEELTTIMQETTNVSESIAENVKAGQEQLQQVFKDSLVTSTIDGLYQAFLILWPYLLIAVAIFVLRVIISKRKRKNNSRGKKWD